MMGGGVCPSSRPCPQREGGSDTEQLQGDVRTSPNGLETNYFIVNTFTTNSQALLWGALLQVTAE